MRVTTETEVGWEGLVGLEDGVRRWYFWRESCESVACGGSSLSEEKLIVIGEPLTICSLRLRFRILRDVV